MVILNNDSEKNLEYWLMVILGILIFPGVLLISYLYNKDKPKDTKQRNIVKTIEMVMVSYGIIIIIIPILFVVVNSFPNNADSDSDSDNGFKTNCYTLDDGTMCCTSCKETSYGDIGCSTSCN